MIFFRPGCCIESANPGYCLLHKIYEVLGVGGRGLFSQLLYLVQLFLLRIIGSGHGARLFLPGNIDEGILGDAPVAPAVIPDIRGQAVDQQNVGDGGAGIANDGAELFKGYGVE